MERPDDSAAVGSPGGWEVRPWGPSVHGQRDVAGGERPVLLGGLPREEPLHPQETVPGDTTAFTFHRLAAESQTTGILFQFDLERTTCVVGSQANKILQSMARIGIRPQNANYQGDG